MVGSMATIADLVSPRERGKYVGLVGGVFAIASVAGPLLGGLLVEHSTWRWIFYINVPLGLIMLVVLQLRLHLPRSTAKPKIDWLGSGLIISAVASLIFVLTLGGVEYDWTSPLILGLSALTIVLAAGFIFWEQRAEEPVVPPRLFAKRTISVANAAAFAVGFGFLGALTFLPLYFQIVKGASPIESGLMLIPLMIGFLSTSTLAGRWISKHGRYRMFPIVGTGIAALGLAMLTQVQVDTPYSLVAVAVLICGVGIGMTQQILVLAVQNDAEPRDLGAATSANAFARAIGGSVGVALFGAIYANRLTSGVEKIPGIGGKIDLSGGVRVSPEIIRHLPEVFKNAFLDVFVHALQGAFLLGAIVTAVAFAISWLLPEVELKNKSAAQSIVADEAEQAEQANLPKVPA
jgi:EmrB/QacA subfamily drug resistance transporter